MKELSKLLKEIEDELKNIDIELATLPPGRLNKRKDAYYHAIDGQEYGITGEYERIAQLGRKKLVLLRRKQLEKNHTLLSKIDCSSPQELIGSLTLLYQGLDKECFYHSEVKKWINEPYKKNTYLPEQRKYASISGMKFRSKSEVIIANLLEKYHLPYRYDAILTMGGQTLCPDFIIKNPYTNKEVIWEHFGALNQSGYEEKMNRKMETYRKSGLTLFDNLIYTFEADIEDDLWLQSLIKRVIFKDMEKVEASV